MTQAQKERIETMNGEELMKLFIGYHNHFNPLDDECCEIYSALKKEIEERLNVYDHM